MSTILLRCSACFFAGAFGFYAYRAGRHAFSRLRKRNTSGLAGKGGTSLLRLYVDELLSNGIALTMPLARILEHTHYASNYSKDMTEKLNRAGYKTSALAFLSLVCFGAIACAAILWVLTRSLAISALATICIPFVLSKVIDLRRAKELAQIKASLPETISLFERCSTTGSTLQQMFTEAAQECDGPLKALFLKISLDLQVGGSIEDALDYLRNNAPADELAFLAIALSIQHQTGGSLSHILKSAAETAQNKIELERKLQAQTAQARLSLRIVALLPFFLLIALSVLSPGFTDPFFSSAIGLALLCLALLMQVAGIAATKHILKEAQ